MKKIYTICIISLILLSCNKSREKNTQIKIYNPEIDLGEVKIKESKEFYITIGNEGTEDLIIYNIQPSCKCTTVTNGDISILPKEKDSIKMTLTANDYGNFEETIAIISNTKPKFSIVRVKSKTIQ